MLPYRVQVTWLDTGEVFPSIQEAAGHMPVSYRSLNRAYRGGKNEACGLKVTFAVTQAMPGNQKAVKNLTTGKTFPSIKAAVEACGGSISGLSYALKEQRRYRGQWWRYASKKPF